MNEWECKAYLILEPGVILVCDITDKISDKQYDHHLHWDIKRGVEWQADGLGRVESYRHD